jgi:hypothetical protein
MRFLMIKGNDPSLFANMPITEKDVQRHRRLIGFGGGIGHYGFPFAMLLWCYLAWPAIFPEGGGLPSAYFIGGTLFTLAAMPVIHEIVHLLALPGKIVLSDTYFVVALNGLRSNLAIRPGGAVSRRQMLWSSLLPLTVLTCVPFLLLALKFQVPYSIGFAACYNFSLSSADIIVAGALFIAARQPPNSDS